MLDTSQSPIWPCAPPEQSLLGVGPLKHASRARWSSDLDCGENAGKVWMVNTVGLGDWETKRITKRGHQFSNEAAFTVTVRARSRIVYTPLQGCSKILRRSQRNITRKCEGKETCTRGMHYFALDAHTHTHTQCMSSAVNVCMYGPLTTVRSRNFAAISSENSAARTHDGGGDV